MEQNERGRVWLAGVAASIGRRVAFFRQRIVDERGRKLTAQGLSDRTDGLGVPLARPTIAKLEKGLRDTLTVGELKILARALGVSPALLLFPFDRESVEALPGEHMSPFEEYRWFCEWRISPDLPTSNSSDIELYQVHDKLTHDRIPAQPQDEYTDSGMGVMMTAARQLLIANLRQVRAIMRERGLIPPRLAPAWAAVIGEEPGEKRTVATAIVTSARGVLAGRRNDNTPPWTFIAGEVEAGESIEDAAVREVKEETGLEVSAGSVIGERRHPITGRWMVYLAAQPVRGTDVFVGDETELAEVRWLSLEEADELLTGMYGPVRDHLARVLRAGDR